MIEGMREEAREIEQEGGSQRERNRERSCKREGARKRKSEREEQRVKPQERGSEKEDVRVIGSDRGRVTQTFKGLLIKKLVFLQQSFFKVFRPNLNPNF